MFEHDFVQNIGGHLFNLCSECIANGQGDKQDSFREHAGDRQLDTFYLLSEAAC